MVPSPPADSLAAAAALWAEHPPTAAQKELAISIAVGVEAEEALIRAGIGRGSGRGRAWENRYAAAAARLESRLAARLPRDRASLDQEVTECAADGVARAFSPVEIGEVRALMATPLGRRFWQASALSLWPLNGCYRSALRFSVTDEDYRFAGVRPPARAANGPQRYD